MVAPLRHRQTKGAATDMPGLLPPRHIPTLPETAARRSVSVSDLWAIFDIEGGWRIAFSCYGSACLPPHLCSPYRARSVLSAGCLAPAPWCWRRSCWRCRSSPRSSMPRRPIYGPNMVRHPRSTGHSPAGRSAPARHGRLRLVTAVLAGFGRTISEVGAILFVGGNIAGYTRTMTTAIVLETSKGNLSLALGLGF